MRSGKFVLKFICGKNYDDYVSIVSIGDLGSLNVINFNAWPDNFAAKSEALLFYKQYLTSLLVLIDLLISIPIKVLRISI